MHSIRPSVLAGEWYPDDPADLRTLIRGTLDRVSAPTFTGSLIGLISPHAGYVYSGFTAAHGYRLLEGKKVDLVAILSPYHHNPSGQYMTTAASAYETPLGQVPVARELIRLLQHDMELTELHGDEEHSIEIQLPFLQTVLKGFSLLPIMVWNPDVNGVGGFARSLERILRGANAILVASTDLHHLHSYADVRSRDANVADALETFDLQAIRTVLAPESCTVCGKVPVSIVLDTAKRLGANRILNLYRSNSKDEYEGEYRGTYTVGYLSAAIIAE